MQDLPSHYSLFKVTDRILLTGHSHQAWPDVAFEAQQRAWLDAAALVDDKWDRAAEIAEDVREGWRRLLNDPGAEIALGQNTHELVVRLLSATLPIFSTRRTRPTRLITTDGEFHTIRRQLDRLAEEGVEVVRIAARPVESLAERVAAAVEDSVACVLVSSVLFETAEIVPHLDVVAEACERHGVTLLIDAYHHLNVVPFDVRAMGLERAFITGGGYKYCQLGEGNGFLRVPKDCELRPVITGWFSEFAALANSPQASGVAYGPGAARFAGATYDPTSHFRAAAVFAFHRQRGLTPERLREINSRQTGLLRDGFEALGVDRSTAYVEVIPDTRRAGFLAIRTPRAADAVRALRDRSIFVDARGDVLRLGPAPYVSDSQLRDGIAAVGECLGGLPGAGLEGASTH
jgi:kynureninase